MKLKVKITTAKVYVEYADGTESLEDIELLGKHTNKAVEQEFVNKAYNSQDNKDKKTIKKVSLVRKEYNDVVYQVNDNSAFYTALKEFASPIDNADNSADNESKGE